MTEMVRPRYRTLPDDAAFGGGEEGEEVLDLF